MSGHCFWLMDLDYAIRQVLRGLSLPFLSCFSTSDLALLNKRIHKTTYTIKLIPLRISVFYTTDENLKNTVLLITIPFVSVITPFMR
ncbi:hypothetical protein GYMLUDRAFT_71974 [Collybiopsis luxurians FD-317 M1]|uniref:Uncharacterized protein n=1 Tax=Collybiopsis luxurians FD-317 M1 TaxID=944289 RepID=A0A0D0CVV7_9AGAR|nr:hypothetical protein GYMLUDRAFT_71974 [Collybiopsis luxurians FD-317 M1]